MRKIPIFSEPEAGNNNKVTKHNGYWQIIKTRQEKEGPASGQPCNKRFWDGWPAGSRNNGRRPVNG